MTSRRCSTDFRSTSVHGSWTATGKPWPFGWRLPDTGDLSLLLETAEISRIANCIIWPCIDAAQAQVDWAFDSLAEMETWFDLIEPALSPG